MHAPHHELFIVLDQFQRRFRQHAELLAPLGGAADDGPRVIGSHAYYRADTDVSLVALRLDPRSVDERKLGWLLATLEHADLLVLDPDRLETTDRDSFYDSYLARYRVHADGAGGPAAALDELARVLGLPDAPPRLAAHGGGAPPTPTTAERLTPMVDAAAARATGFTIPPRPPQLDGPKDGATIDRTPLPRRIESIAPPVAEPGEASEGADARPRRKAAETAGRYAMVRSGKRELLAGSASLIRHPSAARRHLTPTPEVSGSGSSDGLPRARGKHGRPVTPAASGPRAVVRATLPPTAPEIEARFLRGDEWVSARLRAINLRGARFAAGAPPRLGDLVQIVVGLGGHGPMLTGEVTGVIDALSADDGSTGFSVAFPELGLDLRNQLVALLTHAREAGVALRPPPPRGAARFPVHWPTRVLTRQGEILSTALDVSKDGLFFATDLVVEGTDVSFRLPLDLGDREIEGRGTIARCVTGEMATSRGLVRGYGVHIESIGRERQSWEAFLERVRQRTGRRLLVAARPQRAEALVRSLQGAGYVVTAGSDARALMEQTDADPRPPDAALIDVGLSESDPASQRLRRTFNLKHVPCVTIGEEPPDRARMVVDHLLQIA